VPAVRRSSWVFFYRHDGSFVDVPRLFAGEVKVVPMAQTLAISLLTGEELVVSDAELAVLFAVPSNRWVERSTLAEEHGEELVARLVGQGLLVTDEADGDLAELRRRNERLTADHWHPYAALYHFMTRWQDVDVERLPRWAAEAGDSELPPSEEELTELLHELGPAPSAFVHVDAKRSHDLPLPTLRRRLFDTLGRRKTSRSFDDRVPLTEEQLGTVLHHVFGCRGTARVFADVVAVKKTSPSGGALHPIEAYPLVTNVDGVAPGLYHYDVEGHALESIEKLSRKAARDVARSFAAGQSYFANAHVLVILAARFPRSFWKYRHHQRAYAVLLMDAGHLSQTFSLVCTELGLGAFVTAAVNGADAEKRLGLDPMQEGVLAIVGCGSPAAQPSELEPAFVPFVPGHRAG
jgi:putative peptide maturation dehydrogenase